MHLGQDEQPSCKAKLQVVRLQFLLEVTHHLTRKMPARLVGKEFLHVHGQSVLVVLVGVFRAMAQTARTYLHSSA